MLLKRKAVYTTKSMDFSSVILSSILQVFVFTMVPFIAYLISYRKVRGFGKYIGFHRPEKKAMLYATLFVLVTIPLGPLIRYYFPAIQEITSAKGTVTGHLQTVGLSFSSIILIGVMAFVKTGLAEEIFFRGFLAKRLIK